MDDRGRIIGPPDGRMQHLSLSDSYGVTAQMERIEALSAPGILTNYELQAYQERMVGRRFPRPYEAARVTRARPPFPFPDSHYHETYRAPFVQGARQTAWGDFGKPVPEGHENFYEPRSRIAPEMGKGRTPGTFWDKDFSEKRFRMSGRLDAVGEQLSSYVHPEWPNLQLVCADGMAQIGMAVGHADGGFASTRTFVIGGGFTSAFALGGYTSVRVNVLQLDAGAQVRFVWMNQNVTASNRDLYLPQAIAAAITAVPDGAFQVVLQNADAGWVWTNTVGSNINQNIAAGVAVDVLGGFYTPTGINSAMWIIRPF